MLVEPLQPHQMMPVWEIFGQRHISFRPTGPKLFIATKRGERQSFFGPAATKFRRRASVRPVPSVRELNILILRGGTSYIGVSFFRSGSPQTQTLFLHRPRLADLPDTAETNDPYSAQSRSRRNRLLPAVCIGFPLFFHFVTREPVYYTESGYQYFSMHMYCRLLSIAIDPGTTQQCVHRAIYSPLVTVPFSVQRSPTDLKTGYPNSEQENAGGICGK